jgi:hypothetical protein
VVAQARAVPDHHRRVGPQHRDVVGDGLGVRRADADVDDRHAVLAALARVPRRHLDAGACGALGIGESGAELLDVHRVVREQDVALERLGRRPAAVRQALHRQRHPLGREQEQLPGPHLPADLVERAQQGRADLARIRGRAVEGALDHRDIAMFGPWRRST